MAKVIVGKPYCMKQESPTDSVHDVSLRDAPPGFDSVKAFTAGTECFMLYSDANNKTYPLFLVYFQ